MRKKRFFMKKEAFNKALHELKNQYEIQGKDIKAFLKMPHSSFSDLEHLKNGSINIEKLDYYFSVYNDSKANIALSKSMPLMDCIYYNLFHTSYLIKKLAEEQSDPDEMGNILAKLEHFKNVTEFFNPSFFARDFFCQEDETYYRICDARKAIKLICEKDENKGIKKTLDKAIAVLDELEKSVIEERRDNDNLSKYDVADKLAKLINILPKQNIEKRSEIESIINELDVKGSLCLSKADSYEDNGSNVNFNLVLDEFFNQEFLDSDIIDVFLPKVESDNYTPTDWNDKKEKKNGKMPIYFIFKSARKYVKAYIDEKIWKKKTSPEFKDAVYEQYEKIKGFVLERYNKFSAQNKNFKDKEMWVKIYKELESWNCTFPTMKQQDRMENAKKTLTKDNIAKKVRKTKNVGKSYSSLYVPSTETRFGINN